MDANDFVNWLDGFLEESGNDTGLTKTQVRSIKRKMLKVQPTITYQPNNLEDEKPIFYGPILSDKDVLF